MAEKYHYIEIVIDDGGAITKLRQVDKAADDVGKRLRQHEPALGSWERMLFKIGTASVFSGNALYDMARRGIGLFVGTIKQAVQESASLQTALTGLRSVSNAYSIDAKRMEQTARNLAKDGLLTIASAAQSVKNLLMTGFDADQTETLLQRFKDVGAFGRQGFLSLSQAMEGATQGLKNQLSQLVDNIGLTKNLSQIMKEAGLKVSDLGRIAGDAAIRQKFLNQIMKETQAMMGDAARLVGTYSGQVLRLETQWKLYLAALGDSIVMSPAVAQGIATVTGELADQTDKLGANQRGIDFVTDSVIELTKALRFLVEMANVVQFAFNALQSGIATVLRAIANKTADAVHIWERMTRGFEIIEEKMNIPLAARWGSSLHTAFAQAEQDVRGFATAMDQEIALQGEQFRTNANALDEWGRKLDETLAKMEKMRGKRLEVPTGAGGKGNTDGMPDEPAADIKSYTDKLRKLNDELARMVLEGVPADVILENIGDDLVKIAKEAQGFPNIKLPDLIKKWAKTAEEAQILEKLFGLDNEGGDAWQKIQETIADLQFAVMEELDTLSAESSQYLMDEYARSVAVAQKKMADTLRKNFLLAVKDPALYAELETALAAGVTRAVTGAKIKKALDSFEEVLRILNEPKTINRQAFGALESMTRTMGVVFDALGEGAEGAFKTIIAGARGATDAVMTYARAMLSAKTAAEQAAAAANLAWGMFTLGISTVIGGMVKAHQHAKQLQKDFEAITAELADLGVVIPPTMQLLIDNFEHLHVVLQERVLTALEKMKEDAVAAARETARLIEAGSTAADGFGRRVSVFADDLLSHLDAYVELSDEAKRKALDLTDAIAEGDQERIDALLTEAELLQSNLNKAGADIKALAEAAQGSFDRMGRFAQATFSTVLRTTGSLYQAWKAIEEPVGKLLRLQEELGLEATGTAGKFLTLARVMRDNAPILEALDATTQMIKGFGDALMLDAELAADLGADVVASFDALIAKGVPAAQALALSGPALQALWEASKKYGFALDENTQKLVDQGIEAGVVGEHQRDVNQQILDVLKAIADVFGADYEKGGVSAANRIKDATADTNAELENVNTQLGLVDWEGFKRRGIESVEAVRDSVAHLIEGRSPGLVHVPEELQKAIDAAKAFQAAGTSSMEAVRMSVADLNDEQRSWIMALIASEKEGGRVISQMAKDIAASMNLVESEVQDLIDEYDALQANIEDQRRAHEEQQRINAENAISRREMREDLEREIALLNTKTDLERQLLDLQYDKEDALRAAAAIGGGPDIIALIQEKYRLMAEQAVAGTTGSGMSGVTSDPTASLDAEYAAIRRYASAGAYYQDAVTKLYNRAHPESTTTSPTPIAVTIGEITVSGDESEMAAMVGSSVVTAMKLRGVRFTSRG